MLRFLLIIACASAWISAFAQNVSGFDAILSDVRLLTDRPLQKSMGVTSAQRDRMNLAADRYRKSLEPLAKQKGAATKSDPRAEAAYIEFRRGVLSQLTPAQLKRLREVSLQVAGPAVLANKLVADRVGLSSKQLKAVIDTIDAARKQAASVQREELLPVYNAYRNVKVKTKDAADKLKAEASGKLKAAELKAVPKLKVIARTTNDKILAILTPDQRAKFKVLQGTPYRSKKG